jgi:hypothetical protein
MLGLTRIKLSFLENDRSMWVAVIGLELLSLACPGQGLVVIMVISFMLMSPYQYYGYFNPTSMENRIWGDGIENVLV